MSKQSKPSRGPTRRVGALTTYTGRRRPRHVWLRWVAFLVLLLGVWGAGLWIVLTHHSRGQSPAAAIGGLAARSAVTGGETAAPFALRPLNGANLVHVHFKRHPPKSGVLFDLRSGKVLWQLNPGWRLPIASLTKMMTALIIVRRDSRNEGVLITPQTLAYSGSGVGVLPRGKRIKLETMLNGLLLVSGNDAAIALAQHDAGSVPHFVYRMNHTAGTLGLRCSHFTTPSGIEDQGNHSCALDLAILARADMAQPRIRRIAGRNSAHLRFPIKGGHLDLYNNNPFIREGMKGITGLKTGFTEKAGRCYVTTAKRGNRELGVVLLNTPDPLRQVPKLLDAGFAYRG